MIPPDFGISGDDMDTLKAIDDYNARATRKMISDRVRDDPELAAILPKYWSTEDPAEAFSAYITSGIPRAVSRLVGQFGVEKHHKICDLGCGFGQLAYALGKLGYNVIAAMDPAADPSGFLKASMPAIDIIRDFDVWKQIVGRFDALVSNGTIHHWHHIPLVSRDARRTLKPGGLWFAVQEFYANTARDVVFQMRNHPNATRFKHYEWPYPASAYVDLIQSVGFKLAGIIPHYYRANALIQKTDGVIDDEASRKIDSDIDGTVESFWSEVNECRRNREAPRTFTIPQALIFQRIAV